jgi:hypothetical protein
MTSYEDSYDVPPLQILAERQRSFARSLGDILKWRNGRDGMDAWRAVTDTRLDALLVEVKTVKRMLWGLIFTSLIGFGSVAIAVYFSTRGAHP